MNILNIEHIRKTFGEKVLFDDSSFGVQEGDKIGIVGINGSGKTTLLKIIGGLEVPDEGQVTQQNGLKMAYLPQNQQFPEEEEVLAYVAGGSEAMEWEKESEAKSMLNQLGITGHGERMGNLSGGQKKRAALARVLLSKVDILLLDEPTNHLDSAMVTWLEDYLRRFRQVVIMVTHDRYFLDRVTNRILEICAGTCFSYDADYSTFLELKAEREEMEQASMRKNRSILRMELEWAKRGCKARSTKQRARLNRLLLLQSGAADCTEQALEMDSAAVRMGKKTIELHHVSKSYGEQNLISDFNYIVLRNQRLGIVGPNGCGKSTLMKLIAGIELPDSGTIEVGETIRIGYFAQEETEMDPGQRVIDYMKEVAEYITTKDGKISVSQLLERFLFDAAMQYTPVGRLSGGERRRLYLLRILAQGCNVLVLDEPGNDLDIPTITILEDYLASFPGIIITVSHDRYFLDNVVDRIFEFDGNGGLRQYEGGYTDYMEAKQKEAAKETGAKEVKSTGRKLSGKDWKQNQPSKLKFTYKEQKEYETIDEDIAALEQYIESLAEDMLQYATDFARLYEIMEEKAAKEAALDEMTERWIYLNDLAEKINGENAED